MSQSGIGHQFSFSLSSNAGGPELYLGGLNPSKYVAGSTLFYPVTYQGYWQLNVQHAINNVVSPSPTACIVDTGTNFIV